MPSLVGLGFHPPPGWPKTLRLTGSIASSATRRHLIYSEVDFEVFCPAGATRCNDGGKILQGVGDLYSMPKVPSSVPNFTPIGATTRV